MLHYHQITSEERYTLATLRKQVPRPSQAEMARLMNRHPTTISRELRRNSTPYDGAYRPSRAQEQANGRRSRSRRNSRFQHEHWQLIEQLLRADLSPEQISGRLRRDQVLSISHETIYQRIWNDKRRGGTLFRRLRQRPKYRKRYGTNETRGRLPGKRHISERPLSVEHRQEFGHWEMDTVIGSATHDCILTLVERLTGSVLIAHLPARNAAPENRRPLQPINEQPHLVRTITVDNRTEFHAYEQIERVADVLFYFATPYHSWERGTNESTNGLIRQYLPKRTTMKGLTQSRCNQIACILNNRPRKRHDFLTPIELLSRHVGVAVQT